jgi:hypothetical protein
MVARIMFKKREKRFVSKVQHHSLQYQRQYILSNITIDITPVIPNIQYAIIFCRVMYTSSSYDSTGTGTTTA